MGGLSLVHWIIVGAVLLLLFGGKNKISDVMGDVAKGIKSFKKGLSDDDDGNTSHPAPEAMRTLDHQAQPPRSNQPLSNQPLSNQQPVSQGEPSQEPRRVG